MFYVIAFLLFYCSCTIYGFGYVISTNPLTGCMFYPSLYKYWIWIGSKRKYVEKLNKELKDLNNQN